jgi:hypothetical protein
MVLGREGEEVTADRRKLHDESFMLCAAHGTILRKLRASCCVLLTEQYWGNRIMDDGLGG